MKTFHLIRDSTKIDKILDLIINDKSNMKHTRIDLFYINIYYQVSESKTVYFKVFNPSTYGLETIKKQKEIEYYETTT